MGALKRTVDNVVGSSTKYRYDRVISGSKISNSGDVSKIKLEYENLRPIIKFKIRLDGICEI